MEIRRKHLASSSGLRLMVIVTLSAVLGNFASAQSPSETVPCFQSVNNIYISPTPDQVAVRPRDCLELQRAGFNESGQYKVYPDDGGDPFFVFCDMETDGGGWTVFQRRQDGTVDFYQNWKAYRTGFGPVYGEHWLGNNKIHRLTSQKKYALRVDLWDWEGQSAYAQYDTFYVASEDADYMIALGQYHGTAGSRDSMAHHNGRKFSAFDADNDGWENNCAERYHGAWWYGACIDTCLNGRYYERADSTVDQTEGIIWEFWKGNYHPLMGSEMKIRPA